MFTEIRRRRELRKKVDAALKIMEPHVKWGEPDFDQASKEFTRARSNVSFAKYQLDAFETEVLTRKAQQYGIDVWSDRTSWMDDSESGLSPEDVGLCLTPVGQAKLQAQIREQQRKNWQFWITVITALTGLGGTLIGIISALKR